MISLSMFLVKETWRLCNSIEKNIGHMKVLSIEKNDEHMKAHKKKKNEMIAMSQNKKLEKDHSYKRTIV